MAKLPNPFPGNTTTSPKNTKVKIPTGQKAGYNGTLVAVVLDESGSMYSCLNETIDGFNEYVNGQRVAEGNASLKVNKFEGGNVVDLWGIKDIQTTPPLSNELYVPAGMTNLYDAIGQTVNEIDAYLKPIAEKDRPAVLVLIMTDGAENCSREFNNSDIKQMVKDREAQDWGFTFIGANIDAFAVGSQFGMSANNTMQYATSNTAQTFESLSASTTRYRSAKLAGTSTDAIYKTDMFTDAERSSSGGKNV